MMINKPFYTVDYQYLYANAVIVLLWTTVIRFCSENLFSFRANKYDGGGITVLKERLSNTPYDIVAYSTRRQQDCSGYNPCDRYIPLFKVLL